MLSQEAIKKILDIKAKVHLHPEDMAKHLTLTFYPYDESKVSNNIKKFAHKLKTTLASLGVKFIDFEDALVSLPKSRVVKVVSRTTLAHIMKAVGIGDSNYPGLDALRHMRFDKKVKPGVSVIALGEHETGNLPMDRTMSFTETSVISILDLPSNIKDDSLFHEHFDTMMQLFTHHMTNVAIVVDARKWILYNFNASHPTYRMEDKNFTKHLLHGLVPKIAAPIKPPLLTEFTILKETFNPYDEYHKLYVNDLVQSGLLLEKTGLYPSGKSLEELPFRNEFYRWIGRVHLDHRSGMSYGFLARQLPIEVSPMFEYNDLLVNNDFFYDKGILHVVLHLPQGKFYMRVPDVWVLTQRSGANKTNMDPNDDIIKIGLVNGRMFIQKPAGLKLKPSYKTSFDTKVILANAVGNAIIASILQHFNQASIFADKAIKSGLAIAHWHGYLNRDLVPDGWFLHGEDNPHVSCSSPQSAIYALYGKMRVFFEALQKSKEFMGDIHIEPHHGTNINYWSLVDLGQFLSHREDVSKLGNYYLDRYYS